MGVIHIAEGFKNRRLVIWLCKPVIHILKFQATAPCGIIQPAQAVRVHLTEGNGVLRRVRFPITSGGFQDTPDLTLFRGGQLYRGFCRLPCLRLLLSLSEQ